MSTEKKLFEEKVAAVTGVSREEVEKNKKPVKIASDAPNVLEEYFIAHPLIELDGVPRVVVHTDTNFLKETDDRNG